MCRRADLSGRATGLSPKEWTPALEAGREVRRENKASPKEETALKRRDMVSKSDPRLGREKKKRGQSKRRREARAEARAEEAGVAEANVRCGLRKRSVVNTVLMSRQKVLEKRRERREEEEHGREGLFLCCCFQGTSRLRRG